MIRHLFLLILIPHFIFSVSHQEMFNPHADMNGETSSIVDGKVNAITGSFMLQSVDLSLPGPEPLEFIRSYNSFDLGGTRIGQWRHNLYSTVTLLPEPNPHRRGKYTVTQYAASINEADGSVLTLVGNNPGNHRLKDLYLHTGIQGNKSITNRGCGFLSGRTNLKNLSFQFTKPYGPNPKLVLGSGEVRNFKQLFPSKHPNFYVPSTVVKPSGNIVQFDYSSKGTVGAKALNPSQALLYSSIQLNNFVIPNIHNGEASIVGSDGRKVVYEIDHSAQRKKTTLSYIKAVRSDFSPNESYEYKRSHSIDLLMMTKKSLPEGRYTKIDYYSLGNNQVAGRNVHTNICCRVKTLSEPVGYDETPIVTHSFIYNKNSTEVFDAYLNKTTYEYDNKNRLTGTFRYRGENDLIMSEEFKWADKGKDYGNLLNRKIKNKYGTILVEKQFLYDQYGNVLKDDLIGNLTGEGISTYSRIFEYSQDGMNLPILETDGFTTTTYEYLSGTDKLVTKIISNRQKTLFKREFHTYDHLRVCIETIIDDGSGQEKTDLTNVTQRLITRIHPKQEVPCIGLPEEISEYYLDMDTGEEILLKKTIKEYRFDGKILKEEIYDANGDYAFSRSFEYDQMGNLLSEIDPLGNIIQREYDANCNLILEIGPNNDQQKVLTYDFSNRVVKEEVSCSEDLLVTHHRYNHLSQKVCSINIFGKETNFEYDALGRLTKKIHPEVLDENGSKIYPEEAFEYDVLGNTTSHTDALGFTTKTSFNINSKPLLIVYPDGNYEKMVYLVNGWLESKKARNGSTTKYAYDDFGRVISEELYSADNKFIKRKSYQHNTFHLISSTDARGITTHYQYDGSGKKIQQTVGDKTTCFEYDALGRLHKTITLLENDAKIEIQERDLLNRVIEESVETAAGKILKKASYNYDAVGNRTEIIQYNQTGLATTFTEYDSLKRVVYSEDAEGNGTYTRYRYDHVDENGERNLLIEKIDALGRRIISFYDAMNRVISVSKENPFGKILSKETQGYDANGQVRFTEHERIFGEKAIELIRYEWTYNSIGQVTSKSEAVGTPLQAITHYKYNAFGQKEEEIKPSGHRLQFTYNSRGLLKQFEAANKSFIYTYKYDENNNLVLTKNLLEGTKTKRTYDDNNRLIREILANGLMIKYQYDSLGRPTELIYPDGKSAKYNYDPAFLKKIYWDDWVHSYDIFDLSGSCEEETSISGEKISRTRNLLGQITSLINPYHSQKDFEYDAIGRLITYKLEDKIGKNQNQYEYDDLNQLTKESGTSKHQYQYDSLFNRREKDNKFYKINARNQILSDGENTYSYDLDGNLTEGNKRTYTYDSLNRLTTISIGEKAYQYSYDSFNRRLSKKTYKSGDLQEEEKYIYAGNDEIGSWKDGKIHERRILGTGKGAEIEATVFIEIDTRIYVPYHDHNGNIKVLTDTDGDLRECYRFSAFGELEESYSPSGNFLKRFLHIASPIGNPWRFSSKRIDPETGFIFFGCRYYSPKLGRFITADPKGYKAGPNFYAYVLNEPLLHIDLYGLVGSKNRKMGYIHTRVVQPNRLQRIRQYGQAACRTAADLNWNFNVFPGYRQFIHSTLSWLGGNGFYDHPPSYRESQVFTVGTFVHKASERHTYINGICTSYQSAKEAAQNESEHKGGEQITCFYNSTKGFLLDTFDVGLEKIGITTDSVRNARNGLTKMFSQLESHGHKKDARIYFTGHSEGALIGYNASQKLNPAQRKKMNMVTLGGAKIIPKSDYNSAENYASRRDGIPLVADPIGCGISLFSDNYNMKFLESNGIPGLDHFYMGDTYQKLQENLGNDYLEDIK